MATNLANADLVSNGSSRDSRRSTSTENENAAQANSVNPEGPSDINTRAELEKRGISKDDHGGTIDLDDEAAHRRILSPLKAAFLLFSSSMGGGIILYASGGLNIRFC